MTILLLNLSNGIPNGLTYSFNPQCAINSFNRDILNDTFTKELRKCLGELQQIWETIPMGKFTGLAPVAQNGPIDNCTVNGIWSPDLQRAHGGTLPIMRGVPGSRGKPETWTQPQTEWEEVSFGRWVKKHPTAPHDTVNWWSNPKAFAHGTDWAHMDWCQQFQTMYPW